MTLLALASCVQPWFYSVRHNACLPHCRERGQRALEQRLAEKLAAVRSSEGTSLDAADKVWVFYATNNELCSLWIPGDSFLCDFLKDWSNANDSCTFSSPSPTAECFIFWWFFVVIIGNQLMKRCASFFPWFLCSQLVKWSSTKQCTMRYSIGV